MKLPNWLLHDDDSARNKAYSFILSRAIAMATELPIDGSTIQVYTAECDTITCHECAMRAKPYEDVEFVGRCPTCGAIIENDHHSLQYGGVYACKCGTAINVCLASPSMIITAIGIANISVIKEMSAREDLI